MCEMPAVVVHFSDGVSVELSLKILKSDYPAHTVRWLSPGVAQVNLPFRQNKALRRRLFVFERDGWCCHYCGIGVRVETATLDHKIPRIDNTVTCCYQCNREKDDMSYDEYLALWVSRKTTNCGE
ncbi:HNH endonuclease [Planctomycetota bacterium]